MIHQRDFSSAAVMKRTQEDRKRGLPFLDNDKITESLNLFNKCLDYLMVYNKYKFRKDR